MNLAKDRIYYIVLKLLVYLCGFHNSLSYLTSSLQSRMLLANEYILKN